jgi:ABC-type branched-subunit amino acid transport system substrate-binding protein
MRTRNLVVGVLSLAVLAAACGSSSGTKSTSPSSGSGTTASGGKLTATARGVTADTIKVGFSYPDLESLAKQGILKVDNGPYGDIIKALVDDVNASGGINGRKLQLFSDKYSVLAATDQTRVCNELTEDDKVFVILGGFIAAQNACAIQQHATMVIYTYGAGFNSILLNEAKAPFVTHEASDERSTKALVQILDQQGLLKGKKIGVYAQPAQSKPLIDLTVKALEAKGYKATDTALNDAPATDPQAFGAQDKVIANRFKDKGIDVVIVQGTVPPGANFDAAGYDPTFFSPQTSLVTSGAFTNHYDKFPMVAGLAASADQDLGYDTASMKHCRAVWKKASGKDIKKYTEEQKEGKSSGFSAMSTACTALQIFVTAATKAGPDLTYDTFMKALQSLGKIELPASPIASFGPNKPDGQDSFQLMKMNPQWKAGSTGITELLPVGQPITLSS